MGGSQSKILLAISFVLFPTPSRLHGAWLLRVKSAENLRASAPLGSSDPFVIASLTEASPGRRRAYARTSVVRTCLNPSWTDVLEFPVAYKVFGSTMTVPTSFGLSTDMQAMAVASLEALWEALDCDVDGPALAAIAEEFLPPPPEPGRAVDQSTEKNGREIWEFLGAFFG